jgi:hypothetical protein
VNVSKHSIPVDTRVELLDLAAALRPSPKSFDFDKYRRDMLAWEEVMTAELGSLEAAREWIEARLLERFAELLAPYQGKQKIWRNGGYRYEWD